MILDQIVAQKKKEVEQEKAGVSLAELAQKATALTGKRRDLKKALVQPGRISLIAELKKASPSQGLLRKDFQPIEIAKIYKNAGAAALSIITEKQFFQGDLADLQAVRKETDLPILHKDFIIDEFQIYQSVCAGADSVLLIARILSSRQIKVLCALCAQLALEPFCEVHNEADLDKVLAEDVAVIGINNRNLQTFAVDLKVSARLIKRIPQGKIVVSESGIKNAADVKYLRDLGVNAVLVGEALVRADDISAKIKEIMG